MAASSSSGSSFTSSSLGRPPTYSRSYVSPVDSTWTQASEISTTSGTSTNGSIAPPASLRPLDLGPPGYAATITLFQDTPDERTVYLGPWEVVGSEQRRIRWQCSYQSELLEHFLPSDVPSDIHPHTLHSRHRQFNDPPDMERFLSFNEHHRIRYTSGDGICIHDQFIPVRYEFTTVESSVQFQGDLRRKDLVDFYDVDVVWSNLQSRTDGFGKVKGIGAIQRLKLWRDRYTTFHSLSVLANKTDHQYREYDIHSFEGELRNRDDRTKTLRLNVHGRRGSVPEGAPPRRTFRIRQRVRSAGQTSQASPELGPSYAAATLDIRHLSIQFTHKRDYKRFVETWVYAHSSDREFNGVPFPPNHFELPSPEILPGQAQQLLLSIFKIPPAMRVILAINAGSSSVKISVYLADKGTAPRQIAESQVSGLTAPPAQLKYSRGGQTIIKDKNVDTAVSSQDDAFALLLKTLVDDAELEQVGSKSDVAIACHRIVHGGDYGEAQVITPDTYHHLEALSDLAPLHNGAALDIVDSCMKQLPDAINVACFDSQFHSTIPPHISTYPIDPVIAKKNRLRKYGFHGISYAFISRSVAGFLGKSLDQLNIIALHLGSGASACAIRNGKSWDTSMGLTPLAGLPGATRSGSLHISTAEEILNKRSGWKSLTGTTNFGTIAASDEPQHRLAFDLFVDRVCGFVGSYYVSLGGRVDAIVFAGGIGERSARLRSAVVAQTGCLGFSIDEALNSAEQVDGTTVRDVGGKDSQHRVLVCQTDEQFEMARACADMEALWA
ncbi:acetate kinase [Trichoderma cornu-damae]|uniref:Probable acetate kinase n=1 Tax=Trichoderma cornu-damae TaxID=654480 RepID=A0A9P8QRA0_9HYPO|nr:acetate kinase [Trichoderma cornu-damae]